MQLDEIEQDEQEAEIPKTKDDLKADRVRRRFKRNRFANRALKKGLNTVSDKFEDEEDDIVVMRRPFSKVSLSHLIFRNFMICFEKGLSTIT